MSVWTSEQFTDLCIERNPDYLAWEKIVLDSEINEKYINDIDYDIDTSNFVKKYSSIRRLVLNAISASGAEIQNTDPPINFVK